MGSALRPTRKPHLTRKSSYSLHKHHERESGQKLYFFPPYFPQFRLSASAPNFIFFQILVIDRSPPNFDPYCSLMSLWSVCNMHPNVNACNCHIKLIVHPPQEEDQKQSVVVTNCIPGGQFLRSFSGEER